MKNLIAAVFVFISSFAWIYVGFYSIAPSAVGLSLISFGFCLLMMTSIFFFSSYKDYKNAKKHQNRAF